MARLVLFVLAMLVAGISAGKKITQSSAFSWDTDPICGVGELPYNCHLKKVQCGAITKMLEPSGGYIQNFVICAKAAASELGPVFFKNLGVAYANSTDGKRVSPTITDVRRCALESTGLLQSDSTINRTAIAASITTAFKASPLGVAIGQAATTCPEPTEFMMADFMNCLKEACLQNVLVMFTTAAPPTTTTKTTTTKTTTSQANIFLPINVLNSLYMPDV
ncbi:uncharacterized protein LOC125039562 [Penaeus chinensis]|uniref:uncharacterized protein LOC125039562 n=1 Tax=Penaeus chinensis TaxID=139456 RepID=UPI001FB5A736|nr:uncharacterized protein LOC125039562 [Penaeus chinensis]